MNDESNHTGPNNPANENDANEKPDVAGSTMTVEQELDLLRNELNEARDRLMRSQAEADNVRKRFRRELEDERRFAALPLLTDLLPVVDNVQRAIESAAQVAGAAAVVDGFKMVAQQLDAVLARHHCTPIVALHQPFDPNQHQAIAQQPSAEYPPNTVVLVAQQGYQLHERVLRPAQVIVSRAPDA